MSSPYLLDQNFDSEIKTCVVTKPIEALKSDFAKKIIDHISKHDKFNKRYINDIVSKLEDETGEETLTEKEASDFLYLMDEYQDSFDEIVGRYQ